MKVRPESVWFIVLLGACTSMPPLGVDMGQPAITPIAKSLGTSPAAVAYALSLFMMGYASAPVIFGPLSDRFGRRPILLVGCALFGVSSWGCALAQTMPVFMFWRLFQGAGAGVGTVLAVSIIRDLFEGAMARARLSYLVTLGALAPMVAPTLGVIVLGVGGWRSIYGFLGAVSVCVVAAVAMGLEVSAAMEIRQSLSPSQLFAIYRRALSNRTFVSYALVSVMNFGCLFAYITGSPLLMINTLGATPRVYALLFALISFGFMLGGAVNGRLSMRHVPAARLLGAGLTLTTTMSVLLLVLSVTGAARLGTVAPLLFLATFGSSFVAPNATVTALHPLPEIAGTASSIMVGVQWMVGAGAGALAGLLFDGRTPRGLGMVMSGFALAAMTAYLVFVRRADARERETARPGGQARDAGQEELLEEAAKILEGQ